MNGEHDNLSRLLTLAESGRMHELTAAEIALVEQHVNDDASATRRFRDVVPTPDRGLVSQVSAPLQREWKAVWARIESASASPNADVRTLGSSPLRAFPIFRSLTAVAACVALVLVWQFGPFGTKIAPPPAGWELQLSASNQILELAMSGNESPAVHYDDDGIAVIDYHEIEALPEGASDDDDDSAAALPAPTPTQSEPVRRVVR